MTRQLAVQPEADSVPPSFSFRGPAWRLKADVDSRFVEAAACLATLFTLLVPSAKLVVMYKTSLNTTPTPRTFV